MYSASSWSLSVFDLPAEDVLEQHHTAQWSLHWHFEHVDLYAGNDLLLNGTITFVTGLIVVV